MEGSNFYVYVRNNAVNFTDPWGLSATQPLSSSYGAIGGGLATSAGSFLQSTRQSPQLNTTLQYTTPAPAPIAPAAFPVRTPSSLPPVSPSAIRIPDNFSASGGYSQNSLVNNLTNSVLDMTAGLPSAPAPTRPAPLYLVPPSPARINEPVAVAIQGFANWLESPANATSFGADLTPGVNTAKSAYELATGRDPITGENVGALGQVAAGIGLVPLPGLKQGAKWALKKVGGLFGHADEVVKVAPSIVAGSQYSVGEYRALREVAEPGLDAHHVGQQALMRKFVLNYDPATAPAILVPTVGHTVRKGPQGVVSRSVAGIDSVRGAIARDVVELRRVYPDIPNAQLQELIDLNKSKYPQARK